MSEVEKLPDDDEVTVVEELPRYKRLAEAIEQARARLGELQGWFERAPRKGLPLKIAFLAEDGKDIEHSKRKAGHIHLYP